ncbi:unnamed protein product [Vitrella brassicaformis CCMP3155]|uniref:Uncharacterized protein n=2 Tax=Vitrella brassicaformis TaxID=1169539 RepID=A0A0G4FCB6_VITBC|nr:unnamed protein product [Vitrella brassicaformis CCMP3155]|mmetsp:Transcript_23575/g.67723  ORF Transcript_23575/g.67723 Transcript_23575/m.67723 type:complete len:651 (+) Transcript_23575:1525-3477(+)|eukprot:CEM10843.1 unnamed protein product [Vitrella brassicaformis CCMP3155]
MRDGRNTSDSDSDSSTDDLIYLAPPDPNEPASRKKDLTQADLPPQPQREHVAGKALDHNAKKRNLVLSIAAGTFLLFILGHRVLYGPLGPDLLDSSFYDRISTIPSSLREPPRLHVKTSTAVPEAMGAGAAEPEESGGSFYPSYVGALEHLDWADIPKRAYRPKAPHELQQVVLDAMTTYVMAPPLQPLNTTCGPPANYTTFTEADCSANDRHLGMFTGKALAEPRRIVAVFYFGYDLDIAEIRFEELRHVVDLFVVGESRISTTGLAKPLVMKEALESNARFAHLKDRIMAIELDKATMEGQSSKCPHQESQSCWATQSWARDEVMRQFLKRNEDEGYRYLRHDHDIVIMSDSDEIPAGDVVKLVRHCERVDPAAKSGFAILSWAGHFNLVFSRFKDIHMQLNLDHASIPRISVVPFVVAKSEGFVYRASGPHMLYGGWHLTDYAFQPFLFLKFTSYGEGFGQIYAQDSPAFGESLFGSGLSNMPADIYNRIPPEQRGPAQRLLSAIQRVLWGRPIASSNRRALRRRLLEGTDKSAAAVLSSLRDTNRSLSVWEARVEWAQRRLWHEGWTRDFMPRYVPPDQLGPEYDILKVRQLPWFVACNPHRYPVLLGGTDPRYFVDGRGPRVYRNGEHIHVANLSEWKEVMGWRS